MKTLEEIRQNTGFAVRMVGEDGGMGEIFHGKLTGTVIWSYGGGWEHVSVSPFKHRYTPTWEDMCLLKDMFFYDDECVVQFHPPKDQYVNNMPNCLHLWRPVDATMPTPPSVMVGVRKGQSAQEVYMELNKLEGVTE